MIVTRRQFGAMLLGGVPLVGGCANAARRGDTRPAWGAVATVHPLATQAGLDELARGGNAVDAAVAAAATLGVVDGHNSGIGGGCFVLIRKANGSFLAIDGRETAPAAATRDMFVRNGKVVPGASTTGPLAVGVPGSVAAYERALRDAGRRALRRDDPNRLADAFLPAADLAERGFAIDGRYAKRLAGEAADLARFPATASVFLDGEGRPWPAGHLLRQPDLANTYRSIATRGAEWFYHRSFPNAVDRWMRENGGIVTADDFRSYNAVGRQPIVSNYRDHQIVGFPPPSSGGVHVQQILNILETFDLRALDPDVRAHVTAEAMKMAFADRAFWLGDPDFTNVPRGLVDKAYARDLASRIDRSRASAVDAHGEPAAGSGSFGDRAADPSLGKHTTHIAAADAEGNWVAITTTVNTTFGSKVVIPGTGVLMNNQMDDFSTSPGAPNAFGLVGAEGNAVGPNKRPLSSMSPTIVLRDGQPVLTVGAAGGPTIISQVLQVIVNHLDLGLPLNEAVAAPRLHHQWRPDVVAVERAMPHAIVEGLTSRGHTVAEREQIGVCQAIGWRDGKPLAVADPRVDGAGRVVDRGGLQ